jgi:protein required for attachment to host cells
MAATTPRKSLDRRWIVVADGGNARVLTISADRTSLVTQREMMSADVHRKTHDLISDRPGRSFESGSSTRHSIEAKTDPHELAKERFVADVGAMLVEQNRAGAFDDLVLIVTRAQAKSLKSALDTATAARVTHTWTKDLVKTPNAEIWDRLIEAGMMPPRPSLPRVT